MFLLLLAGRKPDWTNGSIMWIRGSTALIAGDALLSSSGASVRRTLPHGFSAATESGSGARCSGHMVQVGVPWTLM